jgi:alanine dehydrogenase
MTNIDQKMIVISEEEARSLVSPKEAISAVADVFRAMSRGEARNFPVVREKLPEVSGTFGVKSAVDLASGIVGLKTGGYWPRNQARGLKNHQSTTLVCDALTGQVRAVVAANYLTAIRTAAASAIATHALSRPDSKTLAVIGAGAQALPQIEAQSAVRGFTRILIAARDPKKAENVATAAKNMGFSCEITTAEEAVFSADVVVTLTPATEPIIRANWVRKGTHINAVGSDTRGKQELETNLLTKARVFVDSWKQSISIGECQNAFASGLILEADIATIGSVLDNINPGRLSADDITIFDSTGVSLQDLAVARIAMFKSMKKNS